MLSAPFVFPSLFQHNSLLALLLLLQGKNGLFEAALSLFEALPLAVLVQDKTLILHGGLWRSAPKGNYKKLSDVPAAVRDNLGLGSLADLRAACSTKQGNRRLKGGRDPYEEGECAHTAHTVTVCAGSTGSCLQRHMLKQQIPAWLGQPSLLVQTNGCQPPEEPCLQENAMTESAQHRLHQRLQLYFIPPNA
jgi:hypothetical protein